MSRNDGRQDRVAEPLHQLPDRKRLGLPAAGRADDLNGVPAEGQEVGEAVAGVAVGDVHGRRVAETRNPANPFGRRARNGGGSHLVP